MINYNQLIIFHIVENISQLKLDHHGKPANTEREVESWMRTDEELHNRTKRPPQNPLLLIIFHTSEF